jgi:hypothetical protein
VNHERGCGCGSAEDPAHIVSTLVTFLMSASSNCATPRRSEVDAVADILDQFYLNNRDQSSSIEWVLN